MRISTLITGLAICGTIFGAATSPALAHAGIEHRIEVHKEPVADNIIDTGIIIASANFRRALFLVTPLFDHKYQTLRI